MSSTKPNTAKCIDRMMTDAPQVLSSVCLSRTLDPHPSHAPGDSTDQFPQATNDLIEGLF